MSRGAACTADLVCTAMGGEHLLAPCCPSDDSHSDDGPVVYSRCCIPEDQPAIDIQRSQPIQVSAFAGHACAANGCAGLDAALACPDAASADCTQRPRRRLVHRRLVTKSQVSSLRERFVFSNEFFAEVYPCPYFDLREQASAPALDGARDLVVSVCRADAADCSVSVSQAWAAEPFTLDSLLAEIAQRSPELQSRRAEVQAALERPVQARAFDDPMLMVELWQVPIGVQQMPLMITLRQPIPWLGKPARAAVLHPTR